MTESPPVKNYAVAIIFSELSLSTIKDQLHDKFGATAEDIGVLRVVRKFISRGRYAETNRTIILVKRAIFDEMIMDRDFKVSEYKLKDYNYPRKGYSSNFYIRLPENMTVDEAREQLDFKIRVCQSFGLQIGSYSINIPLKSRDAGIHKGVAYITFKKDCPLDDIALTQILIHHTKLYVDDTSHLMDCMWAKNRLGKK